MPGDPIGGLDMRTLLLAGLFLLPPALPHEALAVAAEDGRAWQQAEPYLAPDFEAYFPDDVEGGRLLDQHFEANTLRQLPEDEFLAVIRNGLRRTTNHRTIIISYVGQRFIWGVDPQHPDAIELCYHAADFRSEVAKYGARHYAVYFGLSVVDRKPPAILRTLADLCVAIDDPNDIGRVAWGAESQIDELLPWLAPHLASEDPYDRQKAEAVRAIFQGEVGAFEWAAERAKRPPRPTEHTELPRLRSALRDGDSAARLEAFERIDAEELGGQLDDSYLPDLARAADDPDPAVRARLAVLVGGTWVWNAGLHRISDGAVDILLDLSRDEHPEVRQQAIYQGLSTYRGERDDVLDRLVELATDPGESASLDRVEWALERYGERLATRLERDLAGDDLRAAHAAYALHRSVFGERPAIVPEGIAGPADLVGTWSITVLAHGRPSLSIPLLTVVQDEAGLLTLEGEAAEHDEAFEGGVLADLIATELGEVLHFSFRTRIDDTVLRTTGRLEGDTIHGTSRLDAGEHLVVWMAERQAP
jgi:hypothetical protein